MQDKEIIEKVQSGAANSFGILVKRYQDSILRICYRVTGNQTDAEDLAHETFIEAYIKLSQLRDMSKFGPWVKTIALNVCRNWYRTNRVFTGNIGEGQASPAEDNKQHDKTKNGMRKLPANDRLLLTLHYWENLSYTDLATFLDIPIGTVMSRMHRARLRLKGILEMEEEMPASEINLSREVEAEINTLLAMFGDDSNAMERLSVILQKSPDRLIDIACHSGSEVRREDLSLLLRRLGRDGMEAMVSAYLNGSAEGSENAADILMRSFSRKRNEIESMANNGRKLSTDMAPPTLSWEAYWLIDAMVRSNGDAGKKVALLGRLMDICPDGPTSTLLMHALVSYGANGFDYLINKLFALDNHDEVYKHSNVIFGLCRYGTELGKALIQHLTSEQQTRSHKIALVAAEALARSLNCRWIDTNTVTDEEVALNARFSGKWALPLSIYRDKPVIKQLMAAVLPYATVDDTFMRNTSINILGLLQAYEHIDTIRDSTEHDDPSTRTTAIRALALLEDRASISILMKAMRSTDLNECRAAIDTVSTLKLSEAYPVIVDLLESASMDIKKAAIIALGEMKDEQSVGILRGLLKSKDTQVMKAAASALYGGVKHSAKHEPIFDMSAHIRDGAKPRFYISLDAVIRGLPEIREYHETALTKLISQICIDYSATRRYLIESKLMTRESNIYTLTEQGKAVWRVERFIAVNYA